MKSITVSAGANLTPLDRLDILNIIYQQNPTPELKEWVLYGNQYVHGRSMGVSTRCTRRTAWWNWGSVFYDGIGEIDIYVPPAPTPEIAAINAEISDVYKLIHPRKTHLYIDDLNQSPRIESLRNDIANSRQRLIKEMLDNLKTRKWELEIVPLRDWLDARRREGCTEVVLWPDDLATLMVEHGVEMCYSVKKKTVWFEPGNVRPPHPVCLSLKDPAPVVLNISTMPRVVWDLDMRRDMLIAGTVEEPERVIRHLESLAIR